MAYLLDGAEERFKESEVPMFRGREGILWESKTGAVAGRLIPGCFLIATGRVWLACQATTASSMDMYVWEGIANIGASHLDEGQCASPQSRTLAYLTDLSNLQGVEQIEGQLSESSF